MNGNQFDTTDLFKLYEIGKDYNAKLDYYNKTDLNWNFYNGKQWLGIVTNGLSKWTFNICKSTINYFVAFIMSQKISIKYSAENVPDEAMDEQQAAVKQQTELMSKMADMKWEKDKMDWKLRQLMIDGGVTGDFAAYVYWDAKKETGQLEKGDFCTEMVDGVNVMFGNPNNWDVEAQPYILIIGREMVSKLKEEAKGNGISKSLIDLITSDEENNYQAGESGKIELDNKSEYGKTLYIMKYWKKDGVVYWSKSTKYCPIRKEVSLRIKRYPIAYGNWESMKNSYHGVSVIDGIIDNQISINQMFAMVSYWMRMMAFGKTIIDSTRINSWNNKLGEAVKANGDVNNIVKQLEAGNFNAAILQVIDMAIKYTKDFIGANDSLMGQVNPEQASGTAIISTAQQASMPLGNITANRDQFVEDLGLIWGEFYLTYYKNRNVSYREKGNVVVAPYSTEGTENILLNCKLDVGPSAFYSEIAGIQSLDKLFTEGKITPTQYFERMAKFNIIPDCLGLLEDAKQMEQQQQMMMQEQAMGQQQQMQEEEQQQMMEQEGQVQQEQAMSEQQDAQYQKMGEFFGSLPPDTQEKLLQLPPEETEAMIMKMMKDSVNQSMKEPIM